MMLPKDEWSELTAPPGRRYWEAWHGDYCVGTMTHGLLKGRWGWQAHIELARCGSTLDLGTLEGEESDESEAIAAGMAAARKLLRKALKEATHG